MLKSPTTKRGKPSSGKEKSGRTVLKLLRWDQRLYKFKITKLGKGTSKGINPEQIQSSNIRSVKKPRKNRSIGQKTTRNIKSNPRLRAGGVRGAKGFKATKGRKSRAPKWRILKTNNIRGVQSRSKGIKQGEKHIPAPEAVVLNNGEKRCRRAVLPWGG